MSEIKDLSIEKAAMSTGFGSFFDSDLKQILEGLGEDPLYELVVSIGRPWENYMSFAVPKVLAIGEGEKPAVDLWNLLEGVRRKDPLLLGGHQNLSFTEILSDLSAQIYSKLEEIRTNYTGEIDRFKARRHRDINFFAEKLNLEMEGRVFPHVLGHDERWYECYAGHTSFVTAGIEGIDSGLGLFTMVVKRQYLEI